VPADQPSAEIGERVGREDREHHRDCEQARLVVHVAQQDEMAEAEADPCSAEHRRTDG